MYGSTAGVAALQPRFAAADGEFDATTRPTGTQVTTWLSEVSAMLDLVLARNGYSTPVTDADMTPVLDAFVNEEVASMVEGVNGSGRFGPSDKQGSRSARFALILQDAASFIESISPVGSNGPARVITLTKEDAYSD